MTPPKIYGLIGYPVKHSFSPSMHNAAFKTLNINAEYKLFEIKPEDLRKFLLEDSTNISGFNVTIPHKIKARQILEEKFPYENSSRVDQDLYYVKLSGAINTIKREGEKLKYRNTDAAGFLKSLNENQWFDINNKSILLIGCGGAGRAVIAALSWKNKDVEVKKIYVHDINPEAIESVQEHFLNLPQAFRDIFKDKIEFIFREQIPEKIKNVQLLINASFVGMKEGDPSPVDKSWLHKDLSVYDIVYNRKTQLIKDAESLKRNAKDGLGMLLYQGVAAFELWMEGVPAPIKEMRNALKKEINK